MTIIVDANIILSAIINPHSNIKSLLLSDTPSIDFVSPEFALTEINLHADRICKSVKITSKVFDMLLNRYLRNISLFSHDNVNLQDYHAAEKLTKGIDTNDTWYISFAIALDGILWTGDLKLYKGLKRKGFKNIITTKELTEIIKGLY